MYFVTLYNYINTKDFRQKTTQDNNSICFILPVHLFFRIRSHGSCAKTLFLAYIIQYWLRN